MNVLNRAWRCSHCAPCTCQARLRVRVASPAPFGCSLRALKVAAPSTYSCSPSHLRLQVAWTSAVDGRGCSATQAGCTNCDADPNGAWCLVDTHPCAGSEGEAGLRTG